MLALIKKDYLLLSKRFFLFIFIELCTVSCEANISIYSDNPDEFQSIKDDFSSIWERSDNKDSFVFFTDPHLLSYGNEFSEDTRVIIKNSFEQVFRLYNCFPVSFCLCGGDWLNDGDTQEVAKQKLLFANIEMTSFFPNYYKLLGNHDTNYQGIVSETNSERGDLDYCFINQLYFAETGSAYYSFIINETRFFMLDSWLNETQYLDDYHLTQLEWLAKELRYNEMQHVAMGVHMFYDLSGIVPFSEILVSICEAYNNKSRIEINGKSYDYSESKGKCHFILSGHLHNSDDIHYVGYDNRLPVINTRCFISNGIPTFDLCILDYTNGVLHMLRVGDGKNRNVQLYL